MQANIEKLEKPKIQNVINNDLCIACGACIEACSYKKVKPFYSEDRGASEVAISDFGDCFECTKPCESVCPSIIVNFSKLLKSAEGKGNICHDGNVEQIRIARSQNYYANGISSSGGVIRAVIAHAIQEKIPVICLGKEKGEINSDGVYGDYQPVVVRNNDELLRVPGSIYHSVSFINAINLLRQSNTPCLLVAIPCQIEGIMKYIKTCEPELIKKIYLVCGLICGWMYSNHAIKYFAAYKKINGEIIDVSYRGDDKVGSLVIYMAQEVYKFSRRKFSNFKEYFYYRASFSTDMNRLRCRVCENHLNMLADIAVGDAWLSREKNEKKSIVIIRTKRGEKLFKKLENQNVIQSENSEFVDVIESQSSNLVYGVVAQKFSKFLSFIGISAPQFVYGGSQSIVSLSLRDYFMFSFELIRRIIIRRKLYKTFTVLYGVVTFRRNLSYIMQGRVSKINLPAKKE